jgi:DNA polymerase III delta prime subunit
MVDHKNIESALVKVIKVVYSQGTKKYNKLGALYVNYLKILQRKRDPEDHVKYIAKQRSPNKKTYNERMADFKNWYNEEVYASLENLYKLYFELASQEEVVEKRSKEEVDNILQRIHGLEI